MEEETKVTSDIDTDQENDTVDTTESSEVDVQAILAENTKLKAIIKRRNEKKSEEDTETKTVTVQQEKTSGISREEVVLLAKGFSDDEVEMAKKVASVQGVSTLEAVNDPIFLSWKKNNEEEMKKQKSQLAASTGSGSASKKKSFATAGLSPEEHKEMWKRSRGY